MKKSFLFTSFLLLFMIYFTQKQAYSQVIMNANSLGDADIKVLQVEDPAKADIKVFFVDNEAMANKEGCWFVINQPKPGAKKIFFVENEKDADLKINVVEDISKAGWINATKKSLFN